MKGLQKTGIFNCETLALRTYLNEEPSPRAIACMRVSAKVVLEHQRGNPRALCLLAMVKFLEQDYEAAVKEFKALLEIDSLSERQLTLIRENLAAALLTLGREEEARTVFASIDTELQSAETKMAMMYLADR